MANDRIRHWPFIVLAVVVCLTAAAFTGWVGNFLALSLRMYRSASGRYLDLAGQLLGMAGGTLGGLAWSGLMVALSLSRLRRTGAASPVLVAWGTFAGHGGAFLAAGVLCGGLMAFTGRWYGDLAIWAMAVSAVVGLSFGLVGGLLAWAACELAKPGAKDAAS